MNEEKLTKDYKIIRTFINDKGVVCAEERIKMEGEKR